MQFLDCSFAPSSLLIIIRIGCNDVWWLLDNSDQCCCYLSWLCCAASLNLIKLILCIKENLQVNTLTFSFTILVATILIRLLKLAIRKEQDFVNLCHVIRQCNFKYCVPQAQAFLFSAILSIVLDTRCHVS